MPRVVPLAIGTPVDVLQAAEVFGDELRLNLIRYFNRNPGHRIPDAREALGVTDSRLRVNLQALINCGVIVTEPSPDDKRAQLCSVNPGRLAELLDALRKFTTTTPADPAD